MRNYLLTAVALALNWVSLSCAGGVIGYDAYLSVGNADGPFGTGYPPDYCHVTPVIGRTPEDAGRLHVQEANAVIGDKCWSVCRNPGDFVGAVGLTITIRSRCTGINYSGPVTRIGNPKNLGTPPCHASIGNPINVGTGNKYLSEVDYVGEGLSPLVFRRSYNSAGYGFRWLGSHWTAVYSRRLVFTPSSVTAYSSDGRIYYFTESAQGWKGDPDVRDRLAPVSNPNGSITGWRYTTPPAKLPLRLTKK